MFTDVRASPDKRSVLNNNICQHSEWDAIKKSRHARSIRIRTKVGTYVTFYYHRKKLRKFLPTANFE